MADLAGLDQLLDDALDGFGDPEESSARAHTGAGSLSGRDCEALPGTAVHERRGAPSSLPNPSASSSSSAGFDPLRRARRQGAESTASSSQSTTTQAAASGAAGAGHAKAGRAFDPLGGGLGDKRSDANASKVPQDLDSMADGLAQLLADLASAPGAPASGGAAASPRGASAGGAAAAAAPDFAATLQQLAQETAGAAAAQGGLPGASEGDDAILEGLLSSMRGVMDAPEGGMDGFVQKVMAQLLSKDVLYDPLKQVGAEYPGWLSTHAASLPAAELTRYKTQFETIKQICLHYEDHGDSKFPELMQLLQEMQALGTPPPEIVEKVSPQMGSGFPLFPDKADAPGPGCPMQ